MCLMNIAASRSPRFLYMKQIYNIFKHSTQACASLATRGSHLCV